MNGNAKDAAVFYCSVFRETNIVNENPLVVMMESMGQKFMFLNGGPYFKVNPSISIFVHTTDPAEVLQMWEALIVDGKVLMPLGNYEWSQKYGWVQDKFGLNWQISLGKEEDVPQKFTPFFTFTGHNFGKAEEAVKYYTSAFPDASISGILKHKESPDSEVVTVMHAQFHLCNQVFMAVDSGAPYAFQFDEGVSLVINCQSQKEIDYYWNHLTDGGIESMCGWVKDRFGVSWQIVPDKMGEWMSDPEKSKRVTQAFMQMKKLDWDTLMNA